MSSKIEMVFKKSLEYLLYFFAFILPIQTRLVIRPGELAGGYLEYLTVSLYATDIIIILIILASVFLLVKNARSDEAKKFFSSNRSLIILTALLFFWSLATILAADDKSLALFKAAWIFESVALFWIIVRAGYRFGRLVMALAAGFFFQAGLGIWQFMTQSSFSFKWLGMAAHKASQLGTSVVELEPAGQLPERWLRAYAGFDHPNIFGAAMALGSLLALYYLIKEKSESYIYYFFLAVFFLGLLASFSRSAWLGMLLGFIILFFGIMFQKNLQRKKTVLEASLILGIIFFIFFNLYGGLVNARLSGRGRLEARSTSERLGSIKDATKIIKNKPWLGTGLGNYESNELSLLTGQSGISDQSALKKFRSRLVQFSLVQPAHNSYYLMAAETGLAGLLIFLLILFVLARKIFKNNYDAFTKLATISIFISLIIMLGLDHFWFSLHFGLLFFWNALAVIYRLSLENPRQDIIK